MSGAGGSVLSVLTTSQKGAIAEAAVAKAAIELGIGVYRPYGDERADFIFDLRPQLVRVQCKWAGVRGGASAVRATMSGSSW